MSKKLSKADLAKTINNRLSKGIPTSVIKDAINVICDELSDIVMSGKTLSIDNFGTMCNYMVDGHAGFNVNSGELQYVEPFKQITFIPHYVFSELIKQKKDKFE